MATPRPLRVVEWNVLSFSRIWKGTLVSSFVQPLLYLVGMGLGVGSLVNRNPSSIDALHGAGYARFVAPGLLATTAMMVGAIEGTWVAFGGFKWMRTYFAMTATPLSALDLVLGHLLWVACRVALAGGAVAGAIALVPSARTGGLALAAVAAVPCGLAFTMPLAAYAATVDHERGFVAIQRFVLTPMLLFAGTFFPVEQLPAAVRPIAYATPLWHGVDLCRTIALGTATIARTAGHLAYLLVFVGGGTLACVNRYRRRLAT